MADQQILFWLDYWIPVRLRLVSVDRILIPEATMKEWEPNTEYQIGDLIVWTDGILVVCCENGPDPTWPTRLEEAQ